MTLAELEEVLREARETGRPIERRLLVTKRIVA